MWFFRRPSDATVASFFAAQSLMPLSYHAAGASRGTDWPDGFNHDRNSVRLGSGEAVFLKACAALREWRMFPGSWTMIYPAGALQSEGNCVGLLMRVFGLWWLNALRIVYEVDDDGNSSGGTVKRRVGFAYGTLPGHVESGEERFTVVWLTDDSVHYELHAFSRPRYWMVKLAKPVARALQRRFVRQSLAAMQQATRGNA